MKKNEQDQIPTSDFLVHAHTPDPRPAARRPSSSPEVERLPHVLPDAVVESPERGQRPVRRLVIGQVRPHLLRARHGSAAFSLSGFLVVIENDKWRRYFYCFTVILIAVLALIVMVLINVFYHYGQYNYGQLQYHRRHHYNRRHNHHN